MKVSRDWDAETYERVSIPHEDWANATLDRLDLRGDETVLDAGCGSGRVTGLVIERVPRGRVVAVDGSASMIEAVGGVLRPGDRAIHSDLTALELEDEVDAAFSSAVFHWIADHDLLFARLHAALRPGGRLAAQCGGAGNIETFRRAGEEVATREPYAPYFDDFDRPWNYATAEETEERLRRAGGPPTAATDGLRGLTAPAARSATTPASGPGTSRPARPGRSASARSPRPPPRRARR